MSIIDELKERFITRRKTAAEAKAAQDERWNDALRRVADGTADINGVLDVIDEAKRDVESFERALAESKDIRKKGRVAIRRPDVEREVDDAAVALAALDADHAAYLADNDKQRRALTQQLQEGQAELSRCRQAEAEIVGSDPAVAAAREDLRTIEQQTGPLRERAAGLRARIADLEARVEQIGKHVGPDAGAVTAASRAEIDNARKILADDAERLKILDKQATKARAVVAAAEKAAIERALAGELIAPPAPPAAEERRGRHFPIN